MFVRRFGIGLRAMDRTVDMFRRPIDGVKLQQLVAGVDDVVLSPGRNDNAVITLDGRANAIDENLAASLLDPKELVTIIVYFEPNFLTGLQSHEHELQISARVENTAKVLIILGQIFDVADKSLHCDVLPDLPERFDSESDPADGL